MISETSSSSYLATKPEDQSDQDTDQDVEIEDENPSRARTRGRNKVYEELCQYDDISEAQRDLEGLFHDNKWLKINQKTTFEGTKQFYRCYTVSKSKCPVRLYILQHDDSLKNTVYISDDQHEHDSTKKSRGLDASVKKIIDDLFDKGTTQTNRIEKKLLELGVEMPQKTQIQTYIKQLNKKKNGPKLTYGTLKEWCEQRSEIPDRENLDKVFVAATDFNIKNYELINFDIVITTLRLLDYCKYSKIKFIFF